MGRSTECIRKGNDVVSLFLQTLHRDFGILTISSAAGNCDTFFIAASLIGGRKKAQFLLEVYFFFFSED